VSGAIAVLNSGSSSIKFSLYDADSLAVRVRGQVESLQAAARFTAKDASGNRVAERSWPEAARLGHDGALDHIVAFALEALGTTPLVAVGHRVVHGGLAYDAPVRVDARVIGQLEAYVPLAPLHQPHNLAPIRRLLERAPGIPQVACFDTAFHRTQPELAQMFALPARLHAEGVRRFGFHGLSYEYIASQLPAIDAATRCGALDPGVVLYLMDSHGLDARAVEKMIYQESGLLGVSGISSDMRTLLASPEPAARIAVDLYVYRIRREMGALAAALGGLDAIVFTAGIGENSAEIRERVCRGAGWLGVELDAAANAAGARRISSAASRVSAWRVPTDEEGVIARHTLELAQHTRETVHG